LIGKKLCPRVRPCEGGCIHEDTLFLFLKSRLVFSTFQRMDGSHGTIADGCLAVLPRLKGRTNFLCAFCFSLFGGVYYKSLRSTIIPELSRLTGTWFFLGVFVLSQSGFFFHCRDQACFVLPHNFVCGKSLKNCLFNSRGIYTDTSSLFFCI
jgi:hypothetical protein